MTSDMLERRPATIVSVTAAVAVSAALIGGFAAKLGVGVLVALVTTVTAKVIRRAWRDRLPSGIAAILVLIPLVGIAVALGADAPRPERFSRAIDITVATLFGAAAALIFAGARLLTATRRRSAETPWSSLTAAGFPDDGTGRAGRVLTVTGGLLIGTGLLLVLVAPQGFAGLGVNWPDFVLLAVLAVVALLVAPALAAVAVVGSRDRIERERVLQRQAVAAHLHDSVLQTFALVQRRLDDPDESRRLIRHQERELRDWLAGRDPQRPDALGGALQQVVDEVEAELHASIELELLDDRPLSPELGHMIDAAREAMRNAARHGGGAPIRVLAVADGASTEIYVRDDGPGFALDTVPAERLGIRDAIVGRMAAIGGTAVIDTAPGAGTEIVLRLPTRTENGR